MRCTRAVLSALALLLLSPASSRAQETRLTAAPATSFGWSVSIDGDVAIVGDPGRNSAHFFQRVGGVWTLETSQSGGGMFGSSVAILGSTAVIGAPNASTIGRAYAYTRSGPGGSWRLEGTLTPDPFAGGVSISFGASVAVLSASVVAIGAPRDSQSGGRTGAGSVYVATRDGLGTWSTLGGPLRASDAAAADAFGTSVSGHTRMISGTTYATLITGAPGDDCDPGPGADCGSAYVYLRTGTGGFVLQAKLSASDAAASDAFGTSVAVTEDQIVVGSPSRDAALLSDSGAAYTFTRTGAAWTEQTTLTASDAAAGDLFGFSVGVSGELVAVGAYGDDCASGASSCGAAYLFSIDTGAWREVTRFVASDAAAADALGRAIAISGDSVLAGAYGGSAAYVFVRTLSATGEACSVDGECASGFCTDAVCCASACGGGVADCQACSTSSGGTSDGECTALTPSAAGAFVCRASAGACDVAETCSPTMLECPVDAAPGCPDAGLEPDASISAPDAAAVELDATVTPILDASIGDAGAAPDAGMTPPPAGCSCAVPGSSEHRGDALLLLALGALGMIRRRTRSS